MKPKTPEEIAQFCCGWDGATHETKMVLCATYGIAYDTARHWRSSWTDHSPIPPKEIKAPTGNVEAVFQPPVAEGVTVTLDLPQGTIVDLSDLHFPFQDKETVRLVLNFLREHAEMINVVIYGGDLIDFYQISEYDKNPARIMMLQSDIHEACMFLDEVNSILPQAKKYYLLGNHEDRLRRFLWTKAPALSSLECLEIEQLFGLNERKITLVQYEKGVLVNGVFYILHGDIAAKYSGYTAKAMFEKHGGCGLAGHCHRIGAHLRRDRFGVWGWWENGCLCDLNPDYTANPDWIQGFSLVHFRGRRFWTEQVPIVGHKFIYGGKLYE